MMSKAATQCIPAVFFRGSEQQHGYAVLPGSLAEALRSHFPALQAPEVIASATLLCLLRMHPDSPPWVAIARAGTNLQALPLSLPLDISLAAALTEFGARLARTKAGAFPAPRGESCQLAIAFSDQVTVQAEVVFQPTDDALACHVRGGAEARWLAEALVHRVVRLLQGWIEQPDRKLVDAPYLSELDLTILDRWGHPSRRPELLAATLPELFIQSALAHPQQEAVVTAEQTLRYDELAHAAAALARRLYEHDLAGRPVGILMQRGADLVIAFWAVLQAQGICVFLDPAHPVLRREQIARDAGLVLIIEPSLTELGSFQFDVRAPGKLAQSARPEVPGNPADVAALIYTSGSTGQPKGVRLTHQGLACAARWFVEQNFDRPQRSLANAPVSSVAALFEMVLSLLMGGTLVLPGPGLLKDSDSFIAALQEYAISYFYAPPSFLKLLLAHPELPRCRELQRVTVGGEPVIKEVLEAFFRTLPGVRLTHNYGLSEVSACSLIAELLRDSELAILDRLCPNNTLRLLDDRGQLVPVGVPGEIVLGGSGVTPGYVLSGTNAHRLTTDEASGERLYQTGDRAFLLPGGELCFLGRRDFQVHLHGLRIELAEIDAALRALPEIADAVTVAQSSQGVVTHLCAYVVPRSVISATALRTALSVWLPAPMCPSLFVQLKELPRTPSGKLDRHALPAPSSANLLRTHPFVAPVSELEKVLVQSWARVLGLAPASIGVADSFYELGGDSLRALAFLLDAAHIGLSFGLADLLAGPTIRALAERRPAADPAPADALAAGSLQMTEGQSNLYAWAKSFGGVHRQNLPVVFSLTGPIDIGRLGAALQTVLADHSALRTGFVEVGEQLQPLVVVEASIELELREARGQTESALLAEFVAGVTRPMDLSRPPLMQASLVHQGAEAHLLLLTLNHLVFDGNSYGLLFRALASAYAGHRAPPGRWRFEDFARAQAQWVQSPTVQAHRVQLEAIFDRCIKSVRSVPLPGQDPVVHRFHRHTRLLTGAVPGREMSLPQVLLGSFQLAYHTRFGTPTLLTSVSINGRNRSAYVEMIGSLMTDVTVVTEWTAEDSIDDFLKRAQLAWQHQIVEHLDAPISSRTLLECERRAGRMCVMPSFILNKQELVPALDACGVRWSMVPPERYLTEAHADTLGLLALAVTIGSTGTCHLDFTCREDLASEAELTELAAATCQNAQTALHLGNFTDATG